MATVTLHTSGASAVISDLPSCREGLDQHGRVRDGVVEDDAVLARTNVQQLFGKDFAQNIDVADWEFINRCAQKRDLLAHNMGVVDQHYLTKTGDTTAVEGRKVQITAGELKRLAICLRRLGQELVASL